MFTACPQGYNSTTITMTIEDCDYYVDLCYNCTPLGQVQGWVSVFGFTKVDNNCVQEPPLGPNAIFNEINTQLINSDIFYSLCSYLAPPCSTQQYIYWEVAEQVCWFKRNINGQIYYEPCIEIGDLYCLSAYRICWDNGYLIERYYGPSLNGDPEDCPDYIPPDPPLGQTSDCFKLNTDCTY